MMSLSIVFFLTFMDAYGHEDKITTININCAGEADLELILLVSAFPAISLVWGYVIFHLRHERRSNAYKLPDNY